MAVAAFETTGRLFTWPRAVGSVAWVALVFGTLQIGNLAAFGDHTICGPWGCGPPTEALIAWNGFWLALLMPSVLFVCLRMPLRQLVRPTTWVLAILSIVAIAWMSWQGWTWIANRPESYHQYVVQHMLFSVATLVDVPLLPCLLTAAVAAVVCGYRLRSEPSILDETIDGADPPFASTAGGVASDHGGS